jgi:8-oxo-dGTP diphosphatase
MVAKSAAGTMKDFPRVGLGVFVWKDSKFLMGRRVGKHGTGTWSVPGGWLHFGESWEDCARREVMEETGMQIENLRFVAATNNIFEDENQHSITVWVDSDWVSGDPIVMEPDKFIELDWYDFQSLPQPLFEPCWQNLRKARSDLFTGRQG